MSRSVALFSQREAHGLLFLPRVSITIPSAPITTRRQHGVRYQDAYVGPALSFFYVYTAIAQADLLRLDVDATAAYSTGDKTSFGWTTARERWPIIIVCILRGHMSALLLLLLDLTDLIPPPSRRKPSTMPTAPPPRLPSPRGQRRARRSSRSWHGSSTRSSTTDRSRMSPTFRLAKA